MSADLVVKNLAGGHTHRTLFESLDLTVAPGDVVGVVGANGAGKTTLLRILAGDLEPLDGSVSTAPADAFVGWLPQEHERVAGESVGHYVARRTGAAAATAAMEEAAAALGAGDHTRAAQDAFAHHLDHWQASGAPDLDDRLGPVLADLGLDVDPDALMTSLSGGQAARAALAALLLSRFDVVLLDEPTNDLDLAGLDRLEGFVRGVRAGVVLVSHDREFLSRVVTRIVELDLAQGRVAVYDGGYDAFLDERAVARRHAREAYEEFSDKKADLVRRARVQREWSSQGVRNAIKKSPDNDKIRRKAQMESSEKQGQKVRQMESRIARLEEVEEPRKEWSLQFTISSAPRSSSVVATLDDTTVHLGRFTFGPASLQVSAGDRIGVTGPNGAGKTTLLRLLLGRPHRMPAAPAWVPRSRWARSTRRAPGWPRTPPSATRSRPRCPAWRPPRCARCWRSSASRRTRSRAWSAGSRPASGPGPPWRCSRPAGSTSWCSTSPPTIWTCRRSSSSRRPWSRMTGRCCSCRTTAGCSTTFGSTSAGTSWTAG